MKNLIFNLIFVFCFSQTHLVFAQNSVPKEPPGLTDEEAFLYYQALEAENKIDCENNQKPTTPPDIIYRKPMELYSCVSPSEKERTIMRLGFDPEKVKLRTDPPTTPPPPVPQQNPTPISNGFIDQIIPSSLFDKMPPLSKVLNQLFYLGLLVAIVLAIVMIIRGGVEYMTIDAIYSKESGKNRIKAALGGLLLAFSTILILNTINPSLTSLKLVFPPLERLKEAMINGGLISGTRPLSPMGGPVGSTFTDKELEAYTLQKIKELGFSNLSPSDKAAFFPNGGTDEEWLALASSMIKEESGFNPTKTYPEKFKNSKGEFVISTGLFQLSEESVRGYSKFGYPELANITTEDLKNPQTNIDTGLKILKYWVEKDGVISSSDNKGGAQYWSVLRPTGKLEDVRNLMMNN